VEQTAGRGKREEMGEEKEKERRKNREIRK
jgi:hypothetical protein